MSAQTQLLLVDRCQINGQDLSYQFQHGHKLSYQCQHGHKLSYQSQNGHKLLVDQYQTNGHDLSSYVSTKTSYQCQHGHYSP